MRDPDGSPPPHSPTRSGPYGARKSNSQLAGTPKKEKTDASNVITGKKKEDHQKPHRSTCSR